MNNTRQNTFNHDLYDFLKTRGFNPVPKDTKEKDIDDPGNADVFEFTFKRGDKEYGNSYVTIDDDGVLIVYYDDEQAKSPAGKSSTDLEYDDSWFGLIKSFREFTHSKNLEGFDTRNKDRLGDDMRRRDKNDDNVVNEGYHPMGKMASYNDNIPSVKIILQHNRKLEEGEQRYRNVAKIFLENQDGERFLAPTNRPGIAQVYARHIAEGGVPNDERWNHIKSICEEYSQMAGFVRATRNKQFNESAQSLVSEGINHYQSLRETLGKLRGHRGYNQYFESWTPALMEDDTDGTEINELFVQETVDPRIESVMPILSRLHKKTGETQVREVKELEEWADSIVEGEEISEIAPVVGAIAGRALAGAVGAGSIGRAVGSMAGRAVGSMAGQGVATALSGNDDEETLAEDENTSPVEAAILRRIAHGRTDLLKHGIDKVMNAVKEVADYVGDVEEIGSSDVSGWIRQVERILSSQEVEEDLDPQQKKAGQLGPTEKIGPEGARGKLVGEDKTNDSDFFKFVLDQMKKNEKYAGEHSFHIGAPKSMAKYKRFVKSYPEYEIVTVDAGGERVSGQPIKGPGGRIQSWGGHYITDPTYVIMKKNRDVTESTRVDETVEHDSPEEDVIMDIVNGNIDVYQVVNNPTTKAQETVSDIIKQMYDRISGEHRLDPDDDFEKIYEIIMKELTDEYDPYGQVDEDQMLEDIKRLIK